MMNNNAKRLPLDGQGPFPFSTLMMYIVHKEAILT